MLYIYIYIYINFWQLCMCIEEAIMQMELYTVGHKKTRHYYFLDKSDKYWPIFVFFTAIYKNELRNKNFLKFSPHLKSLAALPCETWNVKCVDIQQGHIQFKTDSKCQVTVLIFSSSMVYINCSKWPPFARTQVVSRARHWSIASFMTFCPMLCHTLNRRWHSSSTSFTRFS